MTAAIYFSPTYTSKKGAEAIAAKMAGDGEILSIDVTKKDACPEKTEFDSDDLVVFGAPVYGGRLYRGCKSGSAGLWGRGLPA